VIESIYLPLFSSIILAAGHSQRMGFPKSLLRWDNEHTFIEHICQVYRSAGCSRLILVVHPQVQGAVANLIQKCSLMGHYLIRNDRPDLGRYYSLLLGFSCVLKDQPCFISNTDNPFVTPNLIRQLLPPASFRGWISPINENRSGHPVLLSYEVIKELMQRGYKPGMSLQQALTDFENQKIEVDDPSIHININTKEDYQRYFDSQQ